MENQATNHAPAFIQHILFVETALCIIRRDIGSPIIIKQLARQAGTNECTLKRMFKQIMNISIYQYVLQLRMHKANQLLTNTQYKIKDIAIECGYESFAGFVTTFRRYHGFTPGEARRPTGL
ncbi:helix-turn-helix transcriptional regulator [Ferruginibacter sp.]